jgi:predicted cupin superfamily sugar epimerase
MSSQEKRLQLNVQVGVWKASRLVEGSAGFGLISETATPWFDFADTVLGDGGKISERFPEYSILIQRLAQG